MIEREMSSASKIPHRITRGMTVLHIPTVASGLFAAAG
jgi:hypothetical protein